MMPASRNSDLRPVKPAEAANAARRNCGEPGPRSGRRRLRHEMRQHLMNQA
jgi:hypothetical protein